MPLPLYPQVDLNQQNYNWVVNTIKELQDQIANGAAGLQVITLASQMTDRTVIYIYKGTEAGYNTDHWYYWDTGLNAWTDGGAFGFDTSLLPLSITNGGTGATDASGARTALGLGTAATVNTPISVANGGTGQTSIAAARNAFGLGNTTGALPIANGGTGSQNAPDARTALGLGTAAVVNTPISVANGGTGQTSIAAARNAFGLGNTTGALPIANGGTGAQNASDARTALGLGAAALIGTPISIANGGTGAATATAALSALGGMARDDANYLPTVPNSNCTTWYDNLWDAAFDIKRYVSGTTDAPTAGGGIVILFRSTSSYGWQLGISENGCYFRRRSGSTTFSAWTQFVTP